MNSTKHHAHFARGLNWVVSIVDVGSFAGMITGLLAGIYGQSRIYFVTLDSTYFWLDGNQKSGTKIPVEVKVVEIPIIYRGV